MKKNKKITIYFVIFSLLLIGIIYAILQANLQINGTAKIGANTWDIHFNNIQVNENSVPIGTGDTAATIDPENNCKVDFSVTLSLPGDFYEFTVDVVNAGTIDGMIGELTKTIKVNNETVSEVPDYLDYIVTYSDGTEILQNHALDAGTTETYLVRLEYKTNIEELPEAATIETSLEPQFIQADNNAIPIRVLPKTATFDTGPNLNIKLDTIVQETSYDKYWFSGVFRRVYELNSNITLDTTHTISTSSSEYPIYAWNTIDSSTNKYYLDWYTEADIAYLNVDASNMFKDFLLLDFEGLETIDTSRTNNFSYMFNSTCILCFSNNLDSLENWDVSSVNNMSYMFENTLDEAPIGTSLEALNGWDIRNVVDFTNMFKYYQGDRDGIRPGSSVNDITFPTFTLRPGIWNKTPFGDLDTVAGTYIPNN